MKLGYQLKAWSGGELRNSKCPPGSRIMEFGLSVNGKRLVGKGVGVQSRASRGMNLAVLSMDGELKYHKAFDTYASSNNSDAFVKQLNATIKRIKENEEDKNGIIIVGADNEARGRLTTEAIKTLSDLGSKKIFSLGYRGSYLFIYEIVEGKGSMVHEDLDNCDDVTYEYKCGAVCDTVYDPDYYREQNPDLKGKSADEVNKDWVDNGLAAGKQGHKQFAAKEYGELYEDLSGMRSDNSALANHYVSTGKAQGRMGVVSSQTAPDGLPTSHLQCYLDARKVTSLKSGDKQWKDLSGKNHHFNFKEGITCDGKRADMSYCGKGIGPSAADMQLGPEHNNGSFTIVMIVRDNVHTKQFPFYISAKNGRRGISCHVCWPNGATYFDHMGCCDAKNRSYYRLGASSTKNHVYVFTRTPDGKLDIYLDGVRVIKGTVFSPTGELTGNVSLGHDKWYASMQVMLIYNIGLPSVMIKKISQWYTSSGITLIAGVRNSRAASAAIALSKTPRPVRHPKALAHGLAFALDEPKADGDIPRDHSGRTLKVTTVGIKGDNESWHKKTYRHYINGPMGSELGLNGNYVIAFRTGVSHYGMVPIEITGYSGKSIYVSLNNTYIHWRHGTGKGSSLIKYTYSKRLSGDKVYFLVRNQSGRHIYINNVKVYSSSDRGSSFVPMNEHVKIMGRNSIGHMSHLYVYNSTLTERQLSAIYNHMHNPYMVKDINWEGARKVCEKNNAVLASSSEMCESPMPGRSILAPVGADKNQWIDLTTCKQVVRKGKVNNAHIKCIPLLRENTYFTALANRGNTLYFFKSDIVLEYQTGEVHKASRIMKITDKFPGVPKEFSTDIQAVAITPNSDMYLFKGEYVTIYNIDKKQVVRQPDLIPAVIGSRISAGQDNFDSVVALGNRISILFKGSNVYYNWGWWFGGKFKIRYLFPNKLSDTGVDAYLTLGNGDRIVVREGNMYKLTGWKDSPIVPLVDYFYELRPPFISVEERCKSIGKTKSKIKALREGARGTNMTKYQHYTRRLRSIIREEREHCQFQNMYEYKKSIEKKKAYEAKLQHSVKRLQSKQQETLAKSSELSRQVAEYEATLAELEKDIALELAKKCPIDGTCTPDDITYMTDTTKLGEEQIKSCRPGHIRNILHKYGYNDKQLKELGAVLDKKASINDFDIRGHSEFHKYVSRDNVKDCPEGDFVHPGYLDSRENIATTIAPSVDVNVNVNVGETSNETIKRLLSSIKNTLGKIRKHPNYGALSKKYSKEIAELEKGDNFGSNVDVLRAQVSSMQVLLHALE